MKIRVRRHISDGKSAGITSGRRRSASRQRGLSYIEAPSRHGEREQKEDRRVAAYAYRRDKTPMIPRKRTDTLPPLRALHKRHKGAWDFGVAWGIGDVRDILTCGRNCKKGVP